MKHKFEKPSTFAEVESGDAALQLPEGLEAVLQKGLAKDCEERFASIKQFGEALNRFSVHSFKPMETGQSASHKAFAEPQNEKDKSRLARILRALAPLRPGAFSSSRFTVRHLDLKYKSVSSLRAILADDGERVIPLGHLVKPSLPRELTDDMVLLPVDRLQKQNFLIFSEKNLQATRAHFAVNFVRQLCKRKCSIVVVDTNGNDLESEIDRRINNDIIETARAADFRVVHIDPTSPGSRLCWNPLDGGAFGFANSLVWRPTGYSLTQLNKLRLDRDLIAAFVILLKFGAVRCRPAGAEVMDFNPACVSWEDKAIASDALPCTPRGLATLLEDQNNVRLSLMRAEQLGQAKRLRSCIKLLKPLLQDSGSWEIGTRAIRRHLAPLFNETVFRLTDRSDVKLQSLACQPTLFIFSSPQPEEHDSITALLHCFAQRLDDMASAWMSSGLPLYVLFSDYGQSHEFLVGSLFKVSEFTGGGAAYFLKSLSQLHSARMRAVIFDHFAMKIAVGAIDEFSRLYFIDYLDRRLREVYAMSKDLVSCKSSYMQMYRALYRDHLSADFALASFLPLSNEKDPFASQLLLLDMTAVSRRLEAEQISQAEGSRPIL